MAQKRPNLVKNVHFWSFWSFWSFFCPFCPMPDQKPMRTRRLGWFSVMWVAKLLISPVKFRIFCPRTTKFGPKFAFLPGLVGSFGALLVGWLVVVARGLYLARHLLTLYVIYLLTRGPTQGHCAPDILHILTTGCNISLGLSKSSHR